MEAEVISVSSVDEAREKILYYIRRYKEKRVFCFGGWDGFGVASVLRSIALAIPSMKDPPPELCFSKIIYIDCSMWESKRLMQRNIAEELKLSDKTMAMFDKQDEEDDFHGVDLGSRDVIRSVAAEIDQTLRKTRHMMIFLNGSDEEVPLSRCGIPEYDDCVVIWAFNKSFLNKHCDFMMISKKLSHKDIPNYTDVLIWSTWVYNTFTRSQFTRVFQEEAASVVARYPSCLQGSIDGTTLVADCCLYGLFLNRSFQATATTSFCWAPHASNYWVCDGLVRGDRAREIATALHTEIGLEIDSDLLRYYGFIKRKLHPESPFLVIAYDDEFGGNYYVKKPYRWVSVVPSGLDLMLGRPPKSEITWTNKEVPKEEMQTIVAGATTVFVAWERTDNNSPHGLPSGLFECCRSLAMLILYYCTFSFVSPPFLHCRTLRFLGLDRCTDDNTAAQFAAGEDCTSEWTFLHSLWVLDLRYMDWGEILSKEKMNLMVNLTELNMDGARCWQYTSRQLKERLPYLQRLRITKPMLQEETTSTTDMSTSSFMDGRSKLQVLDLSGNSNIEKLPTGSFSKASCLEALVLDGCDGLHDVLLSNLLLLRTFSFDGYGPASNWASAATELPPEISRPKSPPPADAHRKDDEVKTSTISLEGCKLLENLFIRGLPNLVELDLSGCAIKILDFTRMVVDVPNLKRLFLIGCEHLRALRFGSDLNQQLELLCIDTTQPGRVLGWSSLAKHKSFRLQVYAVTADARLTWSLFPLISDRQHSSPSLERKDDVYFDINISSSICSAHGGGVVVQVDEAAASSKEMTIEERRHDEKKLHQNQMYDDVFVKVAEARSPMQAFPQPPAQKLNHHMEIGYGSRIVESEIEFPYRNNFGMLMSRYVQSLHVHDVSDIPSLPAITWSSLRWCRLERCPSFNVVFPPGTLLQFSSELEMIWASDLLMARCIWSKVGSFSNYGTYTGAGLQHLHLCSCPSLQFALPLWTRHFNNLKTLHIIHCGSLRHVFLRYVFEHEEMLAYDDDEDTEHLAKLGGYVPEHEVKLAYDKDIAFHGAEFPKLTSIYLHDIPNLQQICDVKMRAPALETIQVRGCWSLRRLPHLGDKDDGRRRPPTVMQSEKGGSACRYPPSSTDEVSHYGDEIRGSG